MSLDGVWIPVAVAVLLLTASAFVFVLVRLPKLTPGLPESESGERHHVEVPDVQVRDWPFRDMRGLLPAEALSAPTLTQWHDPRRAVTVFEWEAVSPPPMDK